MRHQHAPNQSSPVTNRAGTDRPMRLVTATSLFDGHDAAINIMRRLLQAAGAEIIHLGHNRSVDEIVSAALQEDADAIAVSSYQGGHIEFFQYMVDRLKHFQADHIRIFAGGGGTIVPNEVKLLEDYGVTRIYTPEHGRLRGLQGIIDDLIVTCSTDLRAHDLATVDINALAVDRPDEIGRAISAIEYAKAHGDKRALQALRAGLDQFKSPPATVPVLGITGTGGAGKSSLVDELLQRLLNQHDERNIAVLSIDPSRQRTGGALLGDRLRMNALSRGRVYMRSLATRSSRSEVGESLAECIELLKAAGFDMVIVESAGIGQGDAAIVPFVDLAVYAMTAEFGAASQLEKIDMLDCSDLVVINKFDRDGAEDALHDVRKQYQRNHQRFAEPADAMPVFGTTASRFNDPGVNRFFHALCRLLSEKSGADWLGRCDPLPTEPAAATAVVSAGHNRYLAEIADTVRSYHRHASRQSDIAEQLWQLEGALAQLSGANSRAEIIDAHQSLKDKQDRTSARLLAQFSQDQRAYRRDEYVYTVREKEHRVALKVTSLAGIPMPRLALPRYRNQGDLLRWLYRENLPGRFPFTAGVFPFRRADETSTRMFAGEGDAQRTNERFKLLSRDSAYKRLSTAFDSVTLYGQDPDPRPDIYGKIGTSGVSVATLEDMKRLYDGFDLCAANTSVSMTINGPAPIVLAMFLNTAIAQQEEKFVARQGRTPDQAEADGIRVSALQTVRGTVQADILKEDQAQNTCIFAIDFALRMMADIQRYFIANKIRNFYSVSISGYHMAEAGANPITQAAFTLANGFTFVEYYRSLGMDVDAFAANFSFFYSNGMDPEYAVLNRASRRIWAIAMRDRYEASERSQKFKLHVQTSGRSLHAQEIQFNDIRTTLQALTALYDNCNSLHTNSFDEAVTTPTDASVRRALAIQQIIDREYGIYKAENLLQGSFLIEELTDLVEEAILAEFDNISRRGGVLGAMEKGYQRSRIQDESHHYETLKSTGEYPIVGVNTFIDPEGETEQAIDTMEVRRGSERERRRLLENLEDFKTRNRIDCQQALEQLQRTALSGGNIFEVLMEAVKYCSLGQITEALFAVGGQYRRNT